MASRFEESVRVQAFQWVVDGTDPIGERREKARGTFTPHSDRGINPASATLASPPTYPASGEERTYRGTGDETSFCSSPLCLEAGLPPGLGSFERR